MKTVKRQRGKTVPLSGSGAEMLQADLFEMHSGRSKLWKHDQSDMAARSEVAFGQVGANSACDGYKERGQD